MTIGPVTAASVKGLCGSGLLHNGPLATQDDPKPGDPYNKRILQDETSFGVNSRIQKSIIDQAQCPSLCDATQGMAMKQWHRVRKAH